MSSSFDSDSDLARAAGDLRLRDVRALRGRNRWHAAPVVIAEVHAGRLEAFAPAEAEGFAERLHAALPGIDDEDGLGGWAEAVLAAARALHALAGPPIGFSRVVPGEANDPPLLVMEYAEEALGIECAHEAAALVRACVQGEPVEVDAVAAALHAVYVEAHPRPTMTVLIEAARRRGIPVRRDPDDPVVQLGMGANLRRLDGAMTDFTSVIATDITSDKHRTKRLLRRVGLPVPRGDTATALEEAIEIADDIGYPVLIKPLDANDGRGISGRLDGPQAVAAAWPLAVAEHPTVVVETFAPGRDHRVLVVAGKVVAVSERVPAHVRGDGVRTIRALAEAENRKPARDPRNPASPLLPLPLDELTAVYLARSGLILDSVPAAGERVELRGTANISTGGTSIDRTDEIHPRNRALCILAADAAGLDVAGLDVLTPDIAVPFDENGAVIIEVNASPGIRMHTDPDEGAPRDVPGAILDWLYPPGAPAVVPIVAVTGTNGKTTTTRLIAHLLRQGGARVGFTTTDGVYYQGERLMEGDLTGPFAANVVLSNPRVDAAVLETARGGILRSGLGWEGADVAVVLNVASDHLGLDRIHTLEQLAEVKGVIPAAVRPGGHTVLNADQPLVYAMRERSPGEPVLFSLQGVDNPLVAEHLAAGGTASLVDADGGAERFVLRRGEERIEVMPVAEVPLTLGGAARFQLENVMAAVAAVDALGMDLEQIRAGLRTFSSSSETTPGRMNVLRTARGTVVVDYAHNPAAVRALADFAMRTEARRRIGVITMPGDRRDDDLRELGAAAAGLDYVIVKEHPKYGRGRAAGEVSRLIREGLVAGGLPSDRHEAVLDEMEAVRRALALMEPGDVAVIVADDTAGVLALIEPHVLRD